MSSFQSTNHRKLSRKPYQFKKRKQFSTKKSWGGNWLMQLTFTFWISWLLIHGNYFHLTAVVCVQLHTKKEWSYLPHNGSMPINNHEGDFTLLVAKKLFWTFYIDAGRRPKTSGSGLYFSWHSKSLACITLMFVLISWGRCGGSPKRVALCFTEVSRWMSVSHKRNTILRVTMVLLLEKMFTSVGTFRDTYIHWWHRLTVPSM